VEDSQRCYQCGVREWEWDRYEADLWRCEKCTELEYKREGIKPVDHHGWRPLLFPAGSGVDDG
jgi:ribosomal protein L37AE/L43A